MNDKFIKDALPSWIYNFKAKIFFKLLPRKYNPRWRVWRFVEGELAKNAKCASCLKLLEEEGCVWLFEETHYHVCDTCYCAISNEIVRENIKTNISEQ